MIPLEKRLKKRLHVEIGMLQDEIVDIVYALDNTAVLHGGTAIWRCFAGNRFSEDLDFYFSLRGEFQSAFKEKISQRNLVIQKLKKTANLFFAKISDGKVEVRLELNFSRKARGVVRTFERIDGSLADVLTLTVEELILEKVEAYKNRRFARDLYDVFFLSKHVENPALIREKMLGFIAGLKRPTDEKSLGAIVFSGPIPSFEQMVEGLKRVFH